MTIKINLTLSDTEILYHLTNELGELGLINAKHLMDFYNINNMDKYDIFMSMLRFARNDKTIIGNDDSSIVNIFGRRLLYKRLLPKGIFDKDPTIYQMTNLLSVIHTCYSEFNLHTYELLNHELFRNDEYVRKIIKDILNGDIEIINTRHITGYFRIVSTIVFNLEMYPSFQSDLEGFSIINLEFESIVKVLTDIYRDNVNDNEAKDIFKEHMTKLFIHFIREHSIYKMNVLKSKFQFIDDQIIGKMLTIVDDLTQYIIDNKTGYYTDDDKVKMKKFLKNFNKYAITKLL